MSLCGHDDGSCPLCVAGAGKVHGGAFDLPPDLRPDCHSPEREADVRRWRESRLKELGL